MEDVLKTVANNIRGDCLIAPDEKILVAFSGGPDSVALLHILSRLKDRLSCSLTACYINHNIRPRAALKEMKFCRDFCSGLGIPFILDETNIPETAARAKISVEEMGHRYRRTRLAEIASQHGLDRIALAHHLDDKIETILFRIFRGTGPSGLNTMRPSDGILIRPLYNVRRDHIMDYLQKNDLTYMIDRSNYDCRYSRNYIRHRIIPVIERHFGPKYRTSLASFAQIVAEEDAYLGGQARKFMKKTALLTPGGKIVVDLNRIRCYDIWLRRRIIRLILETLSGRLGAGSFDDIERIDSLIQGKYKALVLKGSISIIRERERIFVIDRKIDIKERKMTVPGYTDIPEIKARMKCREIPPAEAVTKKQKDGLKICMDCTGISFPLLIRGIRRGDRFTPLGLDGSKKIGDFLTDKKIPMPLRDEIPVVLDNYGIIWLVGHQIAERVKITRKTRKVFEIEFKKV
jgi:tRNA(Ile)-lysidine synthase